MRLCRVVGTVVAPQKNPRLEGQTLLLCQPVDLEDKPVDDSFIAIDRVEAGKGDLVLTNKEGGGARIVLNDPTSPVQQMVVAVVDGFSIDRQKTSFDPPVRAVSAKGKGA